MVTCRRFLAYYRAKWNNVAVFINHHIIKKHRNKFFFGCFQSHSCYIGNSNQFAFAFNGLAFTLNGLAFTFNGFTFALNGFTFAFNGLSFRLFAFIIADTVVL